MRAAALAAALAAAALALGCTPSLTGPAAATEALQIRARAVEIAPADPSGLRLLGAVELTADHRGFGGFSGLLVEDGRLTAVTDAGWLLIAPLVDGLRPGPATFAPLPGGSGAGNKSASDAESLARAGGRLAVGFERDHRVELFGGGAMAEHRDRRWERLPGNGGLEALAALPGGGLLAIAETSRDGAFPAWVIATDGSIAGGALPRVGRHEVTGADIGPDGRLYLLRRDFSFLAGFSVRVERYRLDAAGFPRPATREVLAAFESVSGIDNMEGIAVHATAAGATRLTLISDDNFIALQRTLLMTFAIE